MAEEDELLSVEDSADGSFRWTLKKREFCHHFVECGNAAEAQRRAGYQTEQYGNVLLTQGPIRREVARLLRAKLRAQNENEDSVIARLHRWAETDPGDFFHAGWILKDVSELSEDQRKCIKKVTIREHQHGRDVNLEFYDAAKANNELAVILGMVRTADEIPVPPEDTAKAIQKLLQQMDERDAVEPEVQGGKPGPTTH